ncbi:MAG: hypothetical protein PHH84_04445 [Oscillospiraceae bacterium]|nr:hypothetical protein [Oscillospiraceae bacterium]MDD4414169.1 hypothetical protein [Oscillospiraceae bacterium]
MKKMILIYLAFSLLFTATACKNGGNNMSSGNTTTTTNTQNNSNTAKPSDSDKKTVSLPSWNKDEYEPVAQEWKTRAEKILQADKIDKVEYACYDTGAYQVFSSTDSALIEQWKVIIPKFRWTVVPYEAYIGSPPGVLTFYKGKEPIKLLVGNTILSHIQLEAGHPDAMLRIDNLDEVGGEYTSLLMKMGVPSPYITE